MSKASPEVSLLAVTYMPKDPLSSWALRRMFSQYILSVRAGTRIDLELIAPFTAAQLAVHLRRVADALDELPAQSAPR